MKIGMDVAAAEFYTAEKMYTLDISNPHRHPTPTPNPYPLSLSQVRPRLQDGGRR